MKEMNREMELNMKELEQVNGGGFCLIWGAEPKSLTGATADACFVNGNSAYAGGLGAETNNTIGVGATACIFAIFGIGIGANA